MTVDASRMVSDRRRATLVMIATAVGVDPGVISEQGVVEAVRAVVADRDELQRLVDATRAGGPR